MAKNTLKVLLVASEAVPFAKVGGLADVVGAMAKELASEGVEIAVAIPKYLQVIESIEKLRLKIQKTSDFILNLDKGEETGKIESLQYEGVTYFLIDNPAYFQREGIYVDPVTKQDYNDNLKRFVFFSRAVLEGAKLFDFQPDIIHAQDWQTGLIPVYIRTSYKLDSFFSATRTVFTVHNLSYQGIYSVEHFTLTGLDWKYFTINGLEYYGHLNLMKGGIVFSDFTTTVSETYAREVQTPEYGNGLEGVMKDKADQNQLLGIVNGVDYSEWDPQIDIYTKNEFGINFDAATFEKKSELKEKYLQRNKINPVHKDWPLIGMISRLVDQKGWDIILEMIEQLLREDVYLCVLGTGKYEYENRLKKLQEEYPQKLIAHIEFNIDESHLIEAASDFYLMPSRFEPCGLNQLYSLRYGTVPIVRNTGGLADTVQDEKNGFSFVNYNPDDLMATIKRALNAYRGSPAQWKKIVSNGMKQDWSWKKAAQSYIRLYKEVRQSQS